MRRLPSIVLLIVCVACATGPGAAPKTIDGNWESQSFDTPAGPMTLGLIDRTTTVTGSASWAGQTYRVSGTYDRPQIKLMLTTTDGPGLGPGIPPIYVTGKAINSYTLRLNGTTFLRQASVDAAHVTSR
jgi:hypothetical protein